MILLMIVCSMFVVKPAPQVTLNDNLDKLYAVIEDDAEVVISTPTDAHIEAEKVEVEEIAAGDIKGANLGSCALMEGGLKAPKRKIKTKFEKAQAIKTTYMGNYELTAYIETGNPCADGVYPQTGYTAACNDPALWHKWVYIKDYGKYYIHDTGGMASNVIDIYVSSYDEAIQFGRREADVYVIGE